VPMFAGNSILATKLVNVVEQSSTSKHDIVAVNSQDENIVIPIDSDIIDHSGIYLRHHVNALTSRSMRQNIWPKMVQASLDQNSRHHRRLAGLGRPPMVHIHNSVNSTKPRARI